MGDTLHILQYWMTYTDETWGTISPIKINDDVSAPPFCIFLWFYLSSFKFRLAKKLENRQKIGTLI